MQTPTNAQLRISIDTLGKLVQRLNDEAVHFVVQLPQSPLGDRYARNIGLHTSEQINRIETVIAQLKNWHSELQDRSGGQNILPVSPVDPTGSPDSFYLKEAMKLELAML